MTERLVWIKNANVDPMQLDCGHNTLGNGRPTAQTHTPPLTGDEWYCAMCALHIVAALGQEIELVEERLQQEQ